MELKRPKWYPHRPCKAYTLQGFERRVVPRMMRELGISQKDIEKLKKLYFLGKYDCHLDTSGAYRNQRRYHLYYLSRNLGKDRKRRLFDLVERSQMFYVYYGKDGHIEAFVSPCAHTTLGIIPFERL